MVCKTEHVCKLLVKYLLSELTLVKLWILEVCIYGGDYEMYAERLAAFVRALRHLEIEPKWFSLKFIENVRR